MLLLVLALVGCDCGRSHAPSDAATRSDTFRLDAGHDRDAGEADGGLMPCTPGSIGRCGAGEYCAGPDFARCGGKDVFFGSCELRPDDCTGEPIEPVCGCDRTTYDNACLAHAAGVDAEDGACPPGPVCTSTTPCAVPGETTQCVGMSCSGPWYCLFHMHLCSEMRTAFCGCDGATWFDRAGCERRPYAHPGECDPQPPPAGCDPRDAVCGTPPPDCPEDFAPVTIGGCWSGCVPATTCACAEDAECPDATWRCDVTLGRCRPR